MAPDSDTGDRGVPYEPPHLLRLVSYADTQALCGNTGSGDANCYPSGYGASACDVSGSGATPNCISDGSAAADCTGDGSSAATRCLGVGSGGA